MSLTKVSYIPQIDALRAIAVIFVILFHFDPINFSGGFVGVDMFFVISGYIISLKIFREITETSKFNIIAFYQRRIRRIIPALLVMILICQVIIIFGDFYVVDRKFNNFLDSSLYATFGISNILFANSKNLYFEDSFDSNLLIHTWSLGVEEQFYLVFSLILLFSHIRKNPLIQFLSLGIISLLIGFNNYNYHFHLEKFYLLQYRAYEFIFGIILAIMQINYFDNKKHLLFKKSYFIKIGKIILILSLFILTLILLFGHGSRDVFYSQRIILICCIATSLIIFLTITNPQITKILTNKIITYVGKISYSLYLYHLPVFYLWQYYHSTYKIIITIIAALISYYFIENPFRKDSFGKIKNIIIVLLALLILSCYFFIKSFIKDDFSQIRLFNENKLLAYKNLNYSKNHSKCYSSTKYIEVPGCFDKINQSSKSKILLTGDSHANIWIKVIDEYAYDNDIFLTFLSSGSCRPLIDSDFFIRPKNKERKNQCLKLRNVLKKKISQNELKPDLVILGGKWQDELNNENFEIEFENTLRFYLSHNIKILILLDVINYHHDIFKIIHEKRFNNLNFTSFDSSYIKDGYHRMKNIQYKVIKKLNNDNIYSFDPEIYQYSANNMTLMAKDNDLFYSDSHHISYLGSKEFSGNLTEIIDQMLKDKN